MQGKNLFYSIVIISIIVVIAIVAFLIIKNNQNKDVENNEKQNNQIEEKKENTENNETKTNQPKEEKVDTEDNKEVAKNPIVTMQIKNFGTVKIELYPDIAPNTVANFISLIKEGYYDGLIFHRIIPGFVVQGGDKEGTGSGETEFTIRGEFSKNGFTNNLKHEKGVISMARADYSQFGKTEEGYNSAFSQFFIMLEDQRSLNGLYAGFGKVIEGMDVIDSLADIQIGANDRPVNPPVMEKVTVETSGVEYDEPERLKAFDIKSYIYGN